MSCGAELSLIGKARTSRPPLNMCRPCSHEVLARYWITFDALRSSATVVPICPARLIVTTGKVVTGLPSMTLCGKPSDVGLKLRFDEVRLDWLWANDTCCSTTTDDPAMGVWRAIAFTPG